MAQPIQNQGNQSQNPKQLDIYIIAGDSGAGKSTIIHCLSGIVRKKIFSLKDAGGNVIEFYGCVQSLQEGGINPQAFIREVNSIQNIDAVLVPLSLNSKYNANSPYPKAEDYIKDFASAGWNIKFITELDNKTNKLQLFSSQNSYVYKQFQKNGMCLNETASDVRNFFNLI